MPNIGAMMLSNDAPVSFFEGTTVERSSEIVKWSGIVVPNPRARSDEYDICIYLRIPSAAEPMGGLGIGQRKSGLFQFGVVNKGAHGQAEQAVRLAMYGDRSFYGIPTHHWMQDVLFARESRALKQQGHGEDPPAGLKLHPSFNDKQLTAKQREALQAAVTNTHPSDAKSNRKADKGNHFFLLVRGPPGTGKSTVSQCIAYHCYSVGETLLITCGANRPLDHLVDKVLGVLPRLSKQWTVPNSVLGVFRLVVDYEESHNQIDRNSQAYQHTFRGEYESTERTRTLQEAIGVAMTDQEFHNVEEYVKRRITTGRPVSLGDHILARLKKARAQRQKDQWVHDLPELYGREESEVEYQLLWDFLGWRNLAVKHNVYYVEIIGETTPQRRARFEELNEVQKAIVRETSKVWRNLQSFYLKHAKIVFCTAQTAGRRILKLFRAQRVIVEEAGQLDEPNTLNSFVRSYSTLRKVILSGDEFQLPPTVISHNLNEAALYRKVSLLERLVNSGVEVIELNVQFRMDPNIANFISRQFYKSRILNANSTRNRGSTEHFKQWVKHYAEKNNKSISPASSLFISVNNSDVMRRKGSTSPCNPAYIERTHDVVMDFLRFLFPRLGFSNMNQLAGTLRMAVACYYTQELTLLKKWLHEVEGLEHIVDVVTVDATQGWEWDVVVLSTTRPGGKYGLGFIRDPKRMNVSLSRAKYGQVTIGHKNMNVGDAPHRFRVHGRAAGTTTTAS